jgi:hypothetical protein
MNAIWFRDLIETLPCGASPCRPAWFGPLVEIAPAVKRSPGAPRNERGNPSNEPHGGSVCAVAPYRGVIRLAN